MNGLIPSRQRATILSFDSLMSSSGGVWAQPALGRAADVWGYAPSYLIGAGICILALRRSSSRAGRTCPPTRCARRTPRRSLRRSTPARATRPAIESEAR